MEVVNGDSDISFALHIFRRETNLAGVFGLELIQLHINHRQQAMLGQHVKSCLNFLALVLRVELVNLSESFLLHKALFDNEVDQQVLERIPIKKSAEPSHEISPLF